MRAKQRKVILLILILGVWLLQGLIQYQGFIPLSSGGGGISPDILLPQYLADPVLFDTVLGNNKSVVDLNEKAAISYFISTVANGEKGVLRGVYSENRFALQIVQQPAGQAGFISTSEDVVTQFSMPNRYGVIGLLAHNYLSGKYFFDLEMGDIIQLVYGDGEIKKYQITDIQSFQADQPNSPNSKFIDIETGAELTASQLFKRVYMGDQHLTLQTCIQEGSEDSWGRLFIIAKPL
ncbi:MAG: sortase [Clostridiales bacterium]|nr:sortase [Clostridiales bacterium]